MEFVEGRGSEVGEGEGLGTLIVPRSLPKPFVDPGSAVERIIWKIRSFRDLDSSDVIGILVQLSVRQRAGFMTESNLADSDKSVVYNPTLSYPSLYPCLSHMPMAVPVMRCDVRIGMWGRTKVESRPIRHELKYKAVFRP